jgi:hypothetical protein
VSAAKKNDHLDPDAIITVVVENPHHEGSLRAERFAAYRTGMKVATAIEKGVPPDVIRWHVAAGHIKVGRRAS